MTRIIHQTVTLIEVPGKGWLWAEHAKQRASLSSLLAMVNASAKNIARNAPDLVILTVITYEPCTELGSRLVKIYADHSTMTTGLRPNRKGL
jgi:hypothetical protein